MISRMTAQQFRKLALSFPDVVESSRMKHPDFRVGGKLFATLSEDNTWAMVKLSPAQQADVIEQFPTMFEAFDNAWGRQGCTKVLLKTARITNVMAAVRDAWTLRQANKK